MLTRRIRNLLLPVLAVISALIVIAGGLLLAGTDPLPVFVALMTGAAGDAYRLSETVVKACPLLYTALAVALGLHAGIWNIGADGQLLVGALATAWVGQYTSAFPSTLAPLLVCGAALTAGGLWAGLPAILKNTRGVNEIISTLMMNFIAIALVSYCVHGPLLETAAQYPQTDRLPPIAQLPRLLPPTRLHLGVVLAPLLAGFLWFLLFRTKNGFKLRATGSNPVAARLAGIRVERQVIAALTLGGALAGLGGGIEVSGVTYRVYENFSPGYGYTAIAVALVGQRSPIGAIFAALFFGALEAGSGSLQRFAGVSSVLVKVFQAVIILFLSAYKTDVIQNRLNK
jgi:general nucleoside transport system permease protein